MSIEPVKLDDLAWNQMVDATRRRIPAASSGQWTLHAPVDPGITLLDLFAYLLEQRVYWMDHAPDSLIRGALSLLGEKPLPTQVAATVMHLPKVDEFLLLPKAERFTLTGSTPPSIFTSDKEVVLLPFEKLDEQRERVELEIDGKDRTADLAHGKVLRLFPASGEAAEVKILFYLRRPLPQNIGPKQFSLFIELFESPNVVPQWSPKVPAPPAAAAKVRWFYSTAPKKRAPFADVEIDDGTAGLRRSGLVSLPIKSDWAPVDNPSDQLFVYALWMVVDKATFSAPPRLSRLCPNVVIARHKRQSVEHKLKLDWLPLPGNEIAIADLPENDILKDYPAIESSIILKILERDGKWHKWRRTSDLDFHGPSDRVFVADRTLGKISFGDGLTGRLPVLRSEGQEQLCIRYRVGGGAAGKLGTSLRWTTTASDGTTVEAVNIVPTVGGEDAETIQAFRERAAASLKARTRAVIREDFEEIACKVPGVAIKRAHAAVGFHPNHPRTPIPGAVTVFIVPDVSRPDVLGESFDESIAESAFVAAPVPDEGALAAVRQKLDEARLVGTEVFVLPPLYRNVKLTLVIESNAANRVELSSRIKLRLRRFFDPLIGGDDGNGRDEGTGWPFGEPVRPSAILRETQGELGKDGTLLNVFIDLTDAKHVAYQIQELSGGPGCGCSLVQSAEGGSKDLNNLPTAVGGIEGDGGGIGGEQTAVGGSWVLGAREAKEFRRVHEGVVSDGPVVDAPACDDVEIGAHHLVKLGEIDVRFERASENQGGLR
jgi:hypothetical protein